MLTETNTPAALTTGHYIIRKGSTSTERITMAGSKIVRLQPGYGCTSDQCSRRWVDTQIARGRMFVITAKQDREFQAKRKALHAEHGKPNMWSPRVDDFEAAAIALAAGYCAA